MVRKLNKIYVSTNGCEEGELSSLRVQNFFESNGYPITKNPEDADILIFWACGLMKEKEDDSIKVIKKLKSIMKISAKLIVWGCLPRINPKSLENHYVGPIIGPKDVRFIEDMIEQKTITIDQVDANSLATKDTFICPSSLKDKITSARSRLIRIPEKIRNVIDPLRATPYYIRVSKGCTGNCTYCSEKVAWGGIESREMRKILGDFERGINLGYRNFFLVAADLGVYGVDINCTLPKFLEKITSKYKNINYKLILNQINPLHMKRLYKDLENVFESGKIGVLGCQVQSGSNRILELMRRPYTAEDWVYLMTYFNRKFPNIELLTHLMVGFPTESDSDFTATYNILDKVHLDQIQIFKYSNRPTILARNFPQQVPEEIKEIRYQQLWKKAQANIKRTKRARARSKIIRYFF